MKMSIEKIMTLDCTKAEEKEILDKIIRRIKPFDKISTDEEIPIDLLEKYVDKVCSKYMTNISYLFYNRYNIPKYWTLALRETVGKTYLDTIHALSLKEVMTKAVIRLYHAIKHNEIKLRRK